MASSPLSGHVSKVSLIEAVNDTTDRWRVVARVLKKWNVFHKEAPTELFCISMLLVDEIIQTFGYFHGTKIQASVMSKSMFSKYINGAIKGKTYFIANFVVSPNTKEYRAANHPFRITFGPQTYMKELEGATTEYTYSFMPISHIRMTDMKDPIDYLIDVIGYVKSMDALEEYRVHGETKNRLCLTLVDEEGLTINCVLYDECAVNVCLASVANMPPPVVMILQLARVAFNDEGLPEVCTSFNATKVSLNEKCPEVKHFIQSSKLSPTPMVNSASQVMTSISSNQSANALLRSHPRIKISEIQHQKIDTFFLIYCEFVKLDTRYGWLYDGCLKYGSKPKYENNKLMCMICKKVPPSIEPKFKVHYTVSDETGKASVVFFDKFVVQVIGNTALELKEERAYDFPDELDNLIGTKMLLKLRLNKYNMDFPNSSISVSAYTYCTDLMDQFNEAGPEVDDTNVSIQPEEHGCEIMDVLETETPPPSVTSTLLPASKDPPTPGLEDLLISQVVANTIPRGKRKQTWKKVTAVGEDRGVSVILSPTKLPPKPMKAIKQEKN